MPADAAMGEMEQTIPPLPYTVLRPVLTWGLEAVAIVISYRVSKGSKLEKGNRMLGK